MAASVLAAVGRTVGSAVPASTVASFGINQLNGAAVQEVTNGANVFGSTVSSLGGRATNGFARGLGSLARTASSVQAAISDGESGLLDALL